MNTIARPILLMLATLSAAGCASVPPPATSAPNNPASPEATEAPIQALDLFGTAVLPPDVARGASPDAPMPEMDHSQMGHSRPKSTPTPEASPDTYTCVMHPHIAKPDFGKCPICGMELIKKPGGKK